MFPSGMIFHKRSFRPLLSEFLVPNWHSFSLCSLLTSLSYQDIIQNFDLRLLASCARSSSNAITRNHIFSLITTLVKIIPDQVLDQIFDILAVVGESTVVQVGLSLTYILYFYLNTHLFLK